jgi:hypothetical protein
MATAVSVTESHEAKLDLHVLQSQLSVKQKNMLNQGTVDELQKLCDDPEYGEEFLDCYKDHLNILKENSKYTSSGYMSAIKFFSLIESGNNITDSYCKVFPERLHRRLKRGQEKSDITGEASRFNGTALVNEVRKVSGIPVNLIHRHLLHEAILSQAKLMRTAKSEMVRQKAGEVLIKELKPTEEHVISVKVEDGAKSAIEQLREATEKLAIQEMQSANAGVSLKTIIEGKIITEVDTEIADYADFDELDDIDEFAAGKEDDDFENFDNEDEVSELNFDQEPGEWEY